jgi:hypothetical protein
MEVSLVAAVVLNASQFAGSNSGKVVDVFWSTQLIAGSVPFPEIKRHGASFSKFLVAMDRDNINPKELHDFGLAALDERGNVVKFFGNQQFAGKVDGKWVRIDKLAATKEECAELMLNWRRC